MPTGDGPTEAQIDAFIDGLVTTIANNAHVPAGYKGGKVRAENRDAARKELEIEWPWLRKFGASALRNPTLAIASLTKLFSSAFAYCGPVWLGESTGVIFGKLTEGFARLVLGVYDMGEDLTATYAGFGGVSIFVLYHFLGPQLGKAGERMLAWVYLGKKAIYGQAAAELGGAAAKALGVTPTEKKDFLQYVWSKAKTILFWSSVIPVDSLTGDLGNFVASRFPFSGEQDGGGARVRDQTPEERGNSADVAYAYAERAAGRGEVAPQYVLSTKSTLDMTNDGPFRSQFWTGLFEDEKVAEVAAANGVGMMQVLTAPGLGLEFAKDNRVIFTGPQSGLKATMEKVAERSAHALAKATNDALNDAESDNPAFTLNPLTKTLFAEGKDGIPAFDKKDHPLEKPLLGDPTSPWKKMTLKEATRLLSRERELTAREAVYEEYYDNHPTESYMDLISLGTTGAALAGETLGPWAKAAAAAAKDLFGLEDDALRGKVEDAGRGFKQSPTTQKIRLTSISELADGKWMADELAGRTDFAGGRVIMVNIDRLAAVKGSGATTSRHMRGIFATANKTDVREYASASEKEFTAIARDLRSIFVSPDLSVQQRRFVAAPGEYTYGMNQLSVTVNDKSGMLTVKRVGNPVNIGAAVKALLVIRGVRGADPKKWVEPPYTQRPTPRMALVFLMQAFCAAVCWYLLASFQGHGGDDITNDLFVYTRKDQVGEGAETRRKIKGSRTLIEQYNKTFEAWKDSSSNVSDDANEVLGTISFAYEQSNPDEGGPGPTALKQLLNVHLPPDKNPSRTSSVYRLRLRLAMDSEDSGLHMAAQNAVGPVTAQEISEADNSCSLGAYPKITCPDTRKALCNQDGEPRAGACAFTPESGLFFAGTHAGEKRYAHVSCWEKYIVKKLQDESSADHRQLSYILKDVALGVGQAATSGSPAFGFTPDVEERIKALAGDFAVTFADLGGLKIEQKIEKLAQRRDFFKDLVKGMLKLSSATE